MITVAVRKIAARATAPAAIQNGSFEDAASFSPFSFSPVTSALSPAVSEESAGRGDFMFSIHAVIIGVITSYPSAVV